MREHAVGRVAVVGVRGQHRAQLPHPRGGLRTVAHDVADQQQQPAVLERVPEVEVAADVLAADAGQVARGELDPRQRRQRRRQQRALERQREPPLGAEQDRVVERHARARRELDQHAPVERALDRADHDRRAHHPPARDQRQRERGLRGQRVAGQRRDQLGYDRRARAEAVDLEPLVRPAARAARCRTGRRCAIACATRIPVLRDSSSTCSSSPTTRPSPKPLSTTSPRMRSSSSTSSVPARRALAALRICRRPVAAPVCSAPPRARARRLHAVGDVVEVDAQPVVVGRRRGRRSGRPAAGRTARSCAAPRSPSRRGS